MSRIARWVIVSGLLLAPFTVAAMASTVWNFRGAPPGDWSATDGIMTQITKDGLRIKATKEGVMYRSAFFTHRVDTLRLTAIASTDMEMKLLWKEKGAKDAMVELPFVLNAGPQTVDVNMAKYDQWNDDTDAIGFAFPAGADLILQAAEFRGWNLVERLEEALFTSWTFDTFRAYSINFLWGPLIVTNPVGRAQLFDSLPPFAGSVNNYVYGLIAVFGLAALVAARRRLDHARRKKYVAAFFTVTIACWLIYDLRMSAEILTYAKTDLQTYVLADDESRNFRQFDDFWNVLEAAMPTLQEADALVFSGLPGAPLLAFVRYALYPIDVLDVDKPHPKNTLWLIYGRNDAALNAQGRLMLGGTVVSEPGTIVKRLDESSFLFRETP